MSEEIKNRIKVASIYIATIIGAGFASGQEIIQFFTSYNRGGFYGILLMGLLFSLIGYFVLEKVYQERIKNYEEFLYPTLGINFGRLMEVAVTIFMFSVFSIMIAGAGNVFLDRLGIPYPLGVAFMSLLCMITILTDMKGILCVSAFVAPILIIGMVCVCLYVIVYKDVTVFSTGTLLHNVTQNWFFSSLLYVSYNSIISIPVMCGLLPYLTSRKTAWVGGVTGGILLCVIALLLHTVLLIFAPAIFSMQLPILAITEKYGFLVNTLYAAVLWLAMYLSAVTSGFAFVDRISNKTKMKPTLLVMLLCALVIPLSEIGFSTLIAWIYPIFGYIGMFMVFIVLFQGAKAGFNRKFKKHNY